MTADKPSLIGDYPSRVVDAIKNPIGESPVADPYDPRKRVAHLAWPESELPAYVIVHLEGGRIARYFR